METDYLPDLIISIEVLNKIIKCVEVNEIEESCAWYNLLMARFPMFHGWIPDCPELGDIRVFEDFKEFLEKARDTLAVPRIIIEDDEECPKTPEIEEECCSYWTEKRSSSFLIQDPEIPAQLEEEEQSPVKRIKIVLL